jgi:hypothetical protein
LTAKEIVHTKNVELRAVGLRVFGLNKILTDMGAKVIDDSGSPEVGKLLSMSVPDDVFTEPEHLFLSAQCPRNGLIIEGVPSVDDFGLPIRTALHAQAWRVGLHPSEYVHPEIRT